MYRTLIQHTHTHRHIHTNIHTNMIHEQDDKGKLMLAESLKGTNYRSIMCKSAL